MRKTCRAVAVVISMATFAVGAGAGAGAGAGGAAAQPDGPPGRTAAPPSAPETTAPEATEVADRVGTTSSSSEPSPYDPQPLPETVSLKVSIPGPIEAVSHVLLAQYFGEFERENLDVEILTVPSSDSLPQLAAGDLDFTVTSFQASFFNALAQGFEMKMIAPLYHSNGGNLDGLYVRNDLVAGAPASLRGTALGSVAGLTGSPTLVIGDYLASGGVGVAEIIATRLPGEAIVAGLESGEVAAGWLLSPIPPGAEDVATRVAAFEPGESLAGVMAGPKQLDGDPLVVQAFLRAIARTVDTYLQGEYYSDPEVVSAMVAVTGAPESAFVAGREFEWSPTLELPSGAPVERLQTYLIEIPDMVVIDQPFPYEQLVDGSFVDGLGLG